MEAARERLHPGTLCPAVFSLLSLSTSPFSSASRLCGAAPLGSHSFTLQAPNVCLPGLLAIMTLTLWLSRTYVRPLALCFNISMSEKPFENRKELKVRAIYNTTWLGHGRLFAHCIAMTCLKMSETTVRMLATF